MTCVHLVKLYQLCEQEGIKLGSSDLIHIVCEKCGAKEVCPSVLTDEYDASPHDEEDEQAVDAKRDQQV